LAVESLRVGQAPGLVMLKRQMESLWRGHITLRMIDGPAHHACHMER
jgi:hypothetical protein